MLQACVSYYFFLFSGVDVAPYDRQPVSHLFFYFLDISSSAELYMKWYLWSNHEVYFCWRLGWVSGKRTFVAGSQNKIDALAAPWPLIPT